MENSMPETKKFITRRDAPDYIRAKHGVPISKSTFDKGRMSGKCRPDAFYGGKELFLPETLDAYATEIVSDRPRKLTA
jgi:hypothetical protein